MYNALNIEGQQKIYNIALEIIGKQKNHELMETREKREKSETKNSNTLKLLTWSIQSFYLFNKKNELSQTFLNYFAVYVSLPTNSVSIQYKYSC